MEGPLQTFLRQRLGIAAHSANLPAPTWVTWSNFKENINDAIIRRQADLAAQAGFRTLAFDSAGRKATIGAEVDTQKFPDFAATTAYVRSKGLRLGLWVSCFRDPDSKDLAALPNAANRPTVRRLNALGMSLCQSLARVLCQRNLRPCAALWCDLLQAGLDQHSLW